MNAQVIDLSKAAILQGDYRTKLLLFLILLVVPGAISPEFERDEVEKTFGRFQGPSRCQKNCLLMLVESVFPALIYIRSEVN